MSELIAWAETNVGQREDALFNVVFNPNQLNGFSVQDLYVKYCIL